MVRYMDADAVDFGGGSVFDGVRIVHNPHMAYRGGTGRVLSVLFGVV